MCVCVYVSVVGKDLSYDIPLQIKKTNYARK